MITPQVYLGALALIIIAVVVSGLCLTFYFIYSMLSDLRDAYEHDDKKSTGRVDTSKSKIAGPARFAPPYQSGYINTKWPEFEAGTDPESKDIVV